VTDTEQQPAPLDEFERLELIHQRMKAEQEAWRKLLESLDEAKRKRMNKTPNDHTNA
jgi:ribonuclease D